MYTHTRTHARTHAHTHTQITTHTIHTHNTQGCIEGMGAMGSWAPIKYINLNK